MAVQTQEQLNMAKKAATELGITIPETINSADLTRNTTTPKITPAVPSTAGAGVLGAVQSSQDQFTQMMQDRAKEAAANKDKSLSDYTTRLFDTPTATELKADQYDKQGVDSAQRELDDINSQIQVEQHALQREIERIQDNAVGAFGGQVQNMVREAENKSLRKQADLAVIQMGLQGKFNTAKAIADRYVDAAMEREKNVIEALKINYEDNKALFTTAEQREFDTLLSNRERAFEEDKTRKQEISDVSLWALQQGADQQTMFAIRNAEDPAEAAKIAASYYAPILERQRAMEDEKLAMERERIDIERSRAPKGTTPGNLSGIAQGLIDGTINPDKLTPTQYGQAMNEIMAAGATPFQQSDKQLQYQIDRADRVMETVDNALGNVNGWTTGYGSLLSKIPSTDARDFQKQIDTIKANIGFNELQAMRAASPTGGALGQVAVQELEYLQSVLGSLDTGQSPTQVRENLNSIKEHYTNWKATVALSKATPQEENFTPMPGTERKATNTNDPLGLFNE